MNENKVATTSMSGLLLYDKQIYEKAGIAQPVVSDVYLNPEALTNVTAYLLRMTINNHTSNYNVAFRFHVNKADSPRFTQVVLEAALEDDVSDYKHETPLAISRVVDIMLSIMNGGSLDSFDKKYCVKHDLRLGEISLVEYFARNFEKGLYYHKAQGNPDLVIDLGRLHTIITDIENDYHTVLSEDTVLIEVSIRGRDTTLAQRFRIDLSDIANLTGVINALSETMSEDMEATVSAFNKEGDTLFHKEQLKADMF